MGYLNTILVLFFLASNLVNTTCYAQNNGRGIKSIVVQINSSEDDAEERLSTGRVNLSSADLELSSDKGKNQIVGLRFNDIDLPQGAIITSAQLVFKPNESNSIWTSLIIAAEDAEHAAPFEETPNNISDRMQTLASVNWGSMDPWSSIADSYTSPDISKVIQEIVDKDDWNANNSIALLLEGIGQRTAESFDGDESGAATLIVDYIEKDKYYTDNNNRMKETVNDQISSTLSVNNKAQISNTDLNTK